MPNAQAALLIYQVDRYPDTRIRSSFSRLAKCEVNNGEQVRQTCRALVAS
jgi:hypothetical protein